MNGSHICNENEGLVESSAGKLFYKKYGNGDRVILAFHGYGQDARVFESVASTMPAYTFYSFALFYHDQSIWYQDGRPLTSEVWVDLIAHFLKKENIDRFSLLGFSLGGKPVLVTMMGFKEHVDEVFLIAPDGIHQNIWYRIATGSIAGRSIFKNMISSYDFSSGMIKLAGRLKLLHKKVERFVMREMATENQRQQVYNTWLLYRNLQLKNSVIANTANAYKIPINFYTGSYDKVVTFQQLIPLYKKLKYKKHVALNSGHSNLIKAFANQDFG